MNEGVASASWTQYAPARRWSFLAILFLVSFSNYVDRQVMSVLIEPIKHEFGVSDTMMGLLTGFAFAATYAVLGIPVARWSDRGDRRFVITLSLAVWSVATMACGVAPTFSLLVLARVVVGVGEAGALPPAQSLIADYFPPHQRTRALAIFMASSTLGYLVAFVGGARLAADYGWRMALIVLGAPGLLLCLMTGFGLREPRRALGNMMTLPSESFVETLRALAAKRSFVLLVLAMVSYFLVAYGAMTWLPAYMKRVLQLDLARIGGTFGLVNAGAMLVGTVGGGAIADVLAKRDPLWLVRFPSLVLIAVLPAYELALTTGSFALFLTGVFIGGLAFGTAVPAMFSALHQVCGSARRATAVAVAFFFSNLLGLGFGPLITGALSDHFTSLHGPVGLRYALMFAYGFLIPAGALLWLSAVTMTADTEA